MHIRVGMIAPTYAYTCMVAPMYAHTCRHDHAYVCIYLCVPGLCIVHIDAHDRIYVRIYLQASSRLCSMRARENEHKTRPNVINLKGMTFCMHMPVQACLCDTQASCLAQSLAQSLGVHGNHQVRP